jgi:hypothetical protein
VSLSVNLECERETDGRWIAEITWIPGAMAYGATREEAMARDGFFKPIRTRGYRADVWLQRIKGYNF